MLIRVKSPRLGYLGITLSRTITSPYREPVLAYSWLYPHMYSLSCNQNRDLRPKRMFCSLKIVGDFSFTFFLVTDFNSMKYAA